MHRDEAQEDQAPAGTSVKRRGLVAALGSAGLLAATGCISTDDDEIAAKPDSAAAANGSSGSSASPVAQQPVVRKAFNHPALHTEADFERMREKVAARAEPWASGWNALVSSSRSQLDRSPRPLEWVVRGGSGQNFAQLYIDVARAYQLALRWKVSGDERYARHAVWYLDAWSSTLKGITGNADRYLAAGIYGYQFANAAEIMRTYTGWPAENLARFQKMMLEVFYPLSRRFLREHNDAEITNYWANWDLCNVACVMAVGILCDREDLYKEALDYYLHGAGNGAAHQAVYHVHPGKLGQWQESGRDQGHCTLGIGLAGAICEMAWNQGDDLYGFDDNRFLAGAEYVAKSNWRNADGSFPEVPYLASNNKQGWRTGLSGAARPHGRAVWESVLHHYEGRLGVAAPYVRRQAEALRPEWDGGNGDQLGFGTLTFARVPITTGKPTGLRVQRRGDQAVLSWWGVPGAESYEVRRATGAAGPYTTIASGIADVLTCTDTLPAGNGSVYYTVVAHTGGGLSQPSEPAVVTFEPRQLFRLVEGAVAASRSSAPAQWAAGRKGGGKAIVLEGEAKPLALPEGLALSLTDFTFAAWVYMEEARVNAWLVGVESGTRRWMYLMPHSRLGKPSFALTTVHGYNVTRLEGTIAMPQKAWAHLAVTVRAGVGTMYLDGRVIGTQPDMTLVPADLGAGMSAWIGRSPYGGDPNFKGQVEDVRVYDGALDAAAIAALAVA